MWLRGPWPRPRWPVWAGPHCIWAWLSVAGGAISAGGRGLRAGVCSVQPMEGGGVARAELGGGGRRSSVPSFVRRRRRRRRAASQDRLFSQPPNVATWECQVLARSFRNLRRLYDASRGSRGAIHRGHDAIDAIAQQQMAERV
ncbi:hypothetical protein NDU88_004373 [Pleurodeles waltl]|uniref:Uncharacterized protein n=1 Tax=Pleurodeles waltl TaxID=8319 RepID=A0AAV7KXI6_PLEWA|nr:hypothetical protein NDU88_004373 [Pleurodeles waltl]